MSIENIKQNGDACPNCGMGTLCEVHSSKLNQRRVYLECDFCGYEDDKTVLLLLPAPRIVKIDWSNVNRAS